MIDTETKTSTGTDVPLCKKSRKLYKRFLKKGVVYWDGDDSPKSYKVLEQLIALAHSAGYRVLRITSGNVAAIGKAEISAGRFAMIGG